MTPPPPLPGPRNYGNYELLSELGRGSMGVVYAARQKGAVSYRSIGSVLGVDCHGLTTAGIRKFGENFWHERIQVFETV